MSQLFVKLHSRGKECKYRKLVTTNDSLYPSVADFIEEVVPYDPATVLEDGAWYVIDAFSQKEFATNIVLSKFDTVDFATLSTMEFRQIDYIFSFEDDVVCFQNIGKSKLVQKKAVLYFGERFEFNEQCAAIPINDKPDAIYMRRDDKLYFQRLSSITGIFRGIDTLYREATQEEIYDFLQQDFINLVDGFSAEKVKLANRKRIALATDTLNRLGQKDREDVFAYISGYCPGLNLTDNSFDVRTEDDLKMLLYGIEQRFYTTQVGGEKRIANSVIKM